MKKRIFNWDHSKNKKYAGRVCPSFNFVKGCNDGTVIWWDENQFCVDMGKLICKCGNTHKTHGGRVSAVTSEFTCEECIKKYKKCC